MMCIHKSSIWWRIDGGEEVANLSGCSGKDTHCRVECRFLSVFIHTQISVVTFIEM